MSRTSVRISSSGKQDSFGNNVPHSEPKQLEPNSAKMVARKQIAGVRRQMTNSMKKDMDGSLEDVNTKTGFYQAR